MAADKTAAESKKPVKDPAEEIVAKNRELTALVEMNREIHSTMHLDRLLRILVEKAVIGVNFERGLIYLIEDDYLRCVAFLDRVKQDKASLIERLTFSTLFPQVHLQAGLNQYFCDEVERRTNGRVKITLYPAGSLTSAVKCFAGVEKGLSDIGMSCPLYVGGRFPVSEIFELPSEITSGWVTGKVYMDIFKKFKLKEYDTVHVLYLHGPGRNILSTRTVPIRKLEDMKGLVLRASGGAAKVIKAWGATPRAMPMGEAFEALSKGVVEGQFAVPETMKGWKHADVVKYATIPPVSTSSCQFVVMNKRTWNKLPSDIQKIITEVAANFPEYHGYVWNFYDRAGMEYFKSLPGREVIEIPKSQKPKWQKAVEPVVAKYIKDKKAKGIPAKEILDYFHERIKYWEARQPSYEESAAWVKANLMKK